MRAVALVALLGVCGWLILDASSDRPPPELLAGKCVGADPCLACKTCRSCKHCRGEGSCGACKSKKGQRALAYFADPVCR